MSAVHVDDRKAVESLISDIQALESRAGRLGLFVTARGLNNAKNACGWELAGNTLAAGAAARQRQRVHDLQN